MNRVLALTLALLAALPAVAFAAAKPGSYTGTSSGKYVQVGMATEPTDRGKVSFTVKGSQVKNFKLTGQLVQCGPATELPVSVKNIKLSSAGKGSATYTNPNVGALTVTITVSARGKATGTVRAKAGGSLCNAAYPVRFTAKPKA